SPEPIRTGLPGLDRYIKGVMKTGGLIQFSGEAGTGKSQLLFSIAANYAMQGTKVLFFDTQGKFRPERIRQMVRNDENSADLLERIDILQSGDPFTIFETAADGESLQKYGVILADDLSEPFLREGFRSKQSAMLPLLARRLNIWGVVNGRFVVVAQRVSFSPTYQQSFALGLQFVSPYLLSSFTLQRLKDYYSITAEGYGEVSRFIIKQEGLQEL
ncbi:MAG: AAA family ATPase, partial [Conexivisphaerales archaeon]